MKKLLAITLASAMLLAGCGSANSTATSDSASSAGASSIAESGPETDSDISTEIRQLGEDMKSFADLYAEINSAEDKNDSEVVRKMADAMDMQKELQERMDAVDQSAMTPDEVAYMADVMKYCQDKMTQ